MKTIALEGRFKAVVNRNTYEATYIFRDIECGEVLLTVPKKLSKMYRSIDKETQFKLLVKVEGVSYQRSLADPIKHLTKLVTVKKLKTN